MFGIPLNTLLAGACVAIGLAIVFRSKITGPASSVLGWFKSSPAKPTRLEAIEWLDKAYEFCPDAEYRTAIKSAITHLYDQHAGPA